ncbi:hypothetical protein [Azospirillum sp.]|uniref:hypothetical protein n=1 Tax=Azospirillum sp. TaxID=34012 RepID=UPI002D6D6C61|nr:hypothetical protein [Azospirillum sp.]HYD68696.1 hypothetical protein [Azospirillum sp.]
MPGITAIILLSAVFISNFILSALSGVQASTGFEPLLVAVALAEAVVVGALVALLTLVVYDVTPRLHAAVRRRPPGH